MHHQESIEPARMGSASVRSTGRHGRELADARLAHEGLEPEDTRLRQCAQLRGVAGDDPAEKADVDETLSQSGLTLSVRALLVAAPLQDPVAHELLEAVGEDVGAIRGCAASARSGGCRRRPRGSRASSSDPRSHRACGRRSRSRGVPIPLASWCECSQGALRSTTDSDRVGCMTQRTRTDHLGGTPSRAPPGAPPWAAWPTCGRWPAGESRRPRSLG